MSQLINVWLRRALIISHVLVSAPNWAAEYHVKLQGKCSRSGDQQYQGVCAALNCDRQNNFDCFLPSTLPKLTVLLLSSSGEFSLRNASGIVGVDWLFSAILNSSDSSKIRLNDERFRATATSNVHDLLGAWHTSLPQNLVYDLIVVLPAKSGIWPNSGATSKLMNASHRMLQLSMHPSP